MRAFRALFPWVCLSACSGPVAPDAAVCQDVISRLCLASDCPGVKSQLEPGLDCGYTLMERTGCRADEFAFSSPSRERVLECRALLLPEGAALSTPPTCGATLRFLNECQDVAVIFQERGGEP